MLKLATYTVLLTVTWSLYSCKPDTKPQTTDVEESEPTDTVITPDEPELTYCGIVLRESSKIDTFRVRRNSVFSNLFDNYLTDDSLLYASIGKADSIFPIHKIIAGNELNMIYTQEPQGKQASHLVYHASPTKKLVLSFKDSAHANWHEVEVDTVRRSIYAHIDRTLYHSILDANVSYELGIELSEVYAWQVNFFRIDRNDFFKVIFDEYHANGECIDIGPVRAALFYHQGDSFYAFNFDKGDDHGYYDENGKSLRKAFLKAPLKYSRISSRYTKRRFHPVQKRWKAHLGTDYAAPTGTPIRTVGDGEIIAASYSRGNGKYVKVKHNSTYTTQYLHMRRIAKGIRNGKRVRQGDVIGYVGSTGLATGPHLCFRFWKNGVQVDPFKVKVPPTTPIADVHMAEFMETASYWEKELNSIEQTQSSEQETDKKD